ncbi:HNH endonuclease [Streptomyces lydicus]|uniref:HNH endonuclease n=1 Tax=Streptomyces lydicus TaxID=47763 RepID=UPI003721852F
MARRLPVGPVPRARQLPPQPPSPKLRTWVAGSCAECFEPFIDRQPHARYCSTACGRRTGRRAWKERAERVVPAAVRAFVYERDGWTCWLCQRPIRRDVQAPHPLSHSVDHVVPQSRGGRHEASNLRAAHFLCNSLRGDRCAVVQPKAGAAKRSSHPS